MLLWLIPYDFVILELYFAKLTSSFDGNGGLNSLQKRTISGSVLQKIK